MIVNVWSYCSLTFRVHLASSFLHLNPPSLFSFSLAGWQWTSLAYLYCGPTNSPINKSRKGSLSARNEAAMMNGSVWKVLSACANNGVQIMLTNGMLVSVLPLPLDPGCGLICFCIFLLFFFFLSFFSPSYFLSLLLLLYVCVYYY